MRCSEQLRASRHLLPPPPFPRHAAVAPAARFAELGVVRRYYAPIETQAQTTQQMNVTGNPNSKIMRLLFPERTNRSQHLLRTIAHLAAFLLVMVIEFQVFEWLHKSESDEWAIAYITTAVIFATYYALGVLVPRARSIGWQPLVLLFVVIPVIGWILWLALFFRSSKAAFTGGDCFRSATSTNENCL